MNTNDHINTLTVAPPLTRQIHHLAAAAERQSENVMRLLERPGVTAEAMSTALTELVRRTGIAISAIQDHLDCTANAAEKVAALAWPEATWTR